MLFPQHRAVEPNATARGPGGATAARMGMWSNQQWRSLLVQTSWSITYTVHSLLCPHASLRAQLALPSLGVSPRALQVRLPSTLLLWLAPPHVTPSNTREGPRWWHTRRQHLRHRCGCVRLVLEERKLPLCPMSTNAHHSTRQRSCGEVHRRRALAGISTWLYD